MPRMAYDEDLANRIREVPADDPGVTEKRMFGGLAFLVGGNISVAASGQGGLTVRVDPEATEALLTKPHARSMEMRGRGGRRSPTRTRVPRERYGFERSASGT